MTITRWTCACIVVPLCLLLLMSASVARAAEEKKFVVYGDINLPPYEYLRDGIPQGAMVDLVHAIAARMGRKPEIVLKKWSESQEAVLSGAGHAVSIMGATREREEKYDFTEETFRITFSLFVLAEAQDRYDSRALADLRIGVTEGGLPQTFLRENHPEATLVVVEDNADGVRRVLRREIDALAANTWSVQHFLSDLNISGVALITPPLAARPSAMAIPKGNPQLVSEINAALRAIKYDGTLDRIINRWSSHRVYIVSQDEMVRASWLAGAGGLLLVLTGAFVWVFRRQRNALALEVVERGRSEAALRQSEEKYRSLFSNMDEGFALGELIYDPQGNPVDFRLIEANGAFYRETGLPQGILDRPAREYLPGLEQYWLDTYHAVVASGVSARLANLNADTRRHYDLCAFRPSPERFAVVFRDITEIVRIEKALRESERDLRELIGMLPGMVWICSAQGAVEFMSQQWLDYTGTSLESQLGEGAFDPIHPEDRMHVAVLWREALETHTSFHVEYRLRRHDGLYRWFKSRGTPLFDAEGGVARWLGVIIDIDDLKRVEQSLSLERDRARGYLQVAGVMLLVLDRSRRIETVNRRGAEILGYTDEAQLAGRDWFELAIPPECRDELREYFARLVSGDVTAPTVYENPVLRADGTQVLIAWRNTVLRDHNGRIIGTLSSGEDVTQARLAKAVLERDKSELERLVAERTAQIVQLQKMEAIGQLTGGVAHDFNNLLQGLASSLFVLEPHIPEGTPRALLEAAQRSIDNGARLTQSLLAFARRQTLAPESIELKALFDNILPLLERTLGGLISIAVDLAANVPPALVDRAQLESAILNLVINARDAMPSGGTLTLSAAPTSVRAGDSCCPPELLPGEYVTISIADTGTGMDEPTLARACEPFFTTKDFGKGSGLGLSMVHGMAAQSGGGVAIRSVPGKGTTVTLYLPCGVPTLGVAPLPRPTLELAGGRTVLLVDDNDLMRDALKFTLEGLGCRVLAANEGQTALSLLRSAERVDVLITDYAMPGMSGTELAHEARCVLPDLPVLLVTGYDERLGDVEGISVLQKPFATAELVKRVAAMLRLESAGGV